MCGLAGVLGDLSQQHKDVFRDLMDVASVRGKHSAGVIAVTQSNGYRWAKEVGPPTYLFDTRRYADATNGFLSGLIGHTRHKTVGEISRQSAHPFDFPERGICGVHNGTLRNYHKLTGHHYNKVDSEVLYEHLSHHGPVDTFGEIEGAWACVWWNNETNTINFIRNKERPLWFAWTKDCKAMFWASELWMLAAVERKIELADGEGDNPKKFISLPENTLWSFEVTPNSRERKVIFKQPIVIEPKKLEVRGHPGNGGTPSGNWQQMAHGGYQRVPDKVVPPKTGGEVPDPFQQAKGGRLNLASSVAGKAIIPISDVSFIAGSSKTGETQASPSGSTSKKTTLSPHYRASRSGVRHDRKRPSADSSPSLVSSVSNKPPMPKVSVRKVAGMWFINDNLRHTEYSEANFEKNTGAECSFCHGAIGGLEEVSEFIDSDNFICKGCITAPKIPDIISA